MINQGYSPIVSESFFGTSRGGEKEGTSSQVLNKHHHQQASEVQSQKECEPDYTRPLEEFELGGTQWAVYQTEEGYHYYLDSATEHSQWEDPRSHGLLRYDEATGEYIAVDIPVISDKYREQSGRGGSGESEYKGSNQRVGADLLELDSEYRDASSRNIGRGGQVRSHGSKPRKIVAEDISPDGKRSHYWSDSDGDGDDASVEELGEKRRGKGGSSGTNGRSRAGHRVRLDHTHTAGIDVDTDDLSDGMEVRRKNGHRVGSSRTMTGGHEEEEWTGQGGRGGFFEVGAGDVDDLDMGGGSARQRCKGRDSTDDTRISAGGSDQRRVRDVGEAEDIDSLELGSDLRKRSNKSSNRVLQGGAFADADDPQFLLDDPEDASCAIDEDGSYKTNCFSPDKASLDRAAQLQRSYSPKIGRGSVDDTGDSDSDLVKRSRKKGRKNTCSAKNRPTAFSDEEDIDYSRPRRGGGRNMKYSDQDEVDEGESSNDAAESDNEGSDWDAESEIDERTKHTNTGKLGNVEVAIKGQSTKKAPRLAKKASKLKPPEDVDENQLKKDKIFSAASGGYGNGGNAFELPPLEHPKPSAFPALKPGGSGFVSPRPQPPLDTAEMEARIQPYVDMLRQGTPVLTVKNSMTRGGESRETIKMMLERADELHLSSDMDLVVLSTETDGRGTGSAQSNKATKEELAALKLDPDVGKYIKMHAMGVPTANIVQKMDLDQVGDENAKRVRRALGLPVDEDEAAPGDSVRDSTRRKASVPLLKIHWNTLPPEKLRNSIFANGQDEDSMQDEELEELEKLFGAQSKAEPEASAQVVDKRMRLLVLDGKRAQNVVIGLAQFKSFASHDALLGAVCAMDDLRGLLNGDKLQNLSQLVPSIPESRKIHGMEGSEHPAELFFMVANKFYPDLPKRLSCFLTCCTFQEAYDSIMTKMKKIIDACNEVGRICPDRT